VAGRLTLKLQGITVESSTCSGGHGLSIGSVGGRSNNVVSNVTFSNNSVKSSVNGALKNKILFHLQKD
jgi:hypothetical protein